MASYCPLCKGLMRPRRGVLECIRCSQQGRARTVLAKGKRIHLGKGQGTLAAPPPAPGDPDPTLVPRPSTWTPKPSGAPHPQLGLFPYDTIRDGQKRFTRDVTLAVARGRHLVAEAPTGIGKTAGSLAPALDHALESGRTVLFLTGRQSQHRIAVETLRQIQERRGARFLLVDLVSKRDMCLRPEASEMHPGRFPDFCAYETRTRSCPYLGEVDEDTVARLRQGVLHVEELMQVAKEAHLCPYLVAMEAAPRAQVVVADYNHLFSDIRDRSLERLGLALSDIVVIVDEAHNLPDRIRQGHAHRITPFLLEQVAQEAKRYKAREVAADVDALRKALAAMADAAEKGGHAKEARLGEDKGLVARVSLESLHDAFEAERRGMFGGRRTLEDVIQDLGPLVKQIQKGTDAQVHADQLREALEDWGRFRTGALRFLEWDVEGTPTLHVRLLDPAVPARQVFDHVHSAVLMSGTLRPPEMIRDLLGLETRRTTVRSYASPFPPQHRFVAVDNSISTRFQERTEALWTRIADTVRRTARATEGNVAVFAPSYRILDDVRMALGEDLAGKEAVVEQREMGKAERDRVLDTLEGARRRGGAVLFGVLGGSFSEGVDFKGGLLSAILVVGLPLAPPDLEVEATIGYMEKKHPGKGRAYGYVVPAMNKVLQAMGRGIRGPEDRCAVLLLDRRYLQPPYRQLLPADVHPVATDDPAGAAAPFLAV